MERMYRAYGLLMGVGVHYRIGQRRASEIEEENYEPEMPLRVQELRTYM
jgi:hypothetical protein